MLIVIGGWAISLVQILTGSRLNRFIVNQVFSVEKRKRAEPSDMTLLERVQTTLKRQSSAKFGAFTMCKKRDRLRIAKADDRLEHELDIINFIRSQMTFSIAIRHLFTKSERFMITR